LEDALFGVEELAPFEAADFEPLAAFEVTFVFLVAIVINIRVNYSLY